MVKDCEKICSSVEKLLFRSVKFKYIRDIVIYEQNMATYLFGLSVLAVRRLANYQNCL